jgi:DNA (cytosine-5)-methyltransferase 1
MPCRHRPRGAPCDECRDAVTAGARLCARCGGEIPKNARSDSRFCGVRCRQAEHRKALRCGHRGEPSTAGDASRSSTATGELVLSLFPGIGLLDRGFEDSGFCVARGPDLIFGGDVHRFRPPAGKFTGVIGGPPCQRFSSLANLVVATGGRLAPNLIPEFERVVLEAQPDWFLMENVPRAPEPVVAGYVVTSRLYNNRWFGGVQNRVRRISWGTRDGRPLLPRPVALEAAEWKPAVLASGGRWVSVKIGGSGKVKRSHARGRIEGHRNACDFRDACRLQGLPDGFDIPAFKAEEKIRAVGNGVPYPLAKALAIAVLEARAGGSLEASPRSRATEGVEVPRA